MADATLPAIEGGSVVGVGCAKGLFDFQDSTATSPIAAATHQERGEVVGDRTRLIKPAPGGALDRLEQVPAVAKLLHQVHVIRVLKRGVERDDVRVVHHQGVPHLTLHLAPAGRGVGKDAG